MDFPASSYILITVGTAMVLPDLSPKGITLMDTKAFLDQLALIVADVTFEISPEIWTPEFAAQVRATFDVDPLAVDDALEAVAAYDRALDAAWRAVMSETPES